MHAPVGFGPKGFHFARAAVRRPTVPNHQHLARYGPEQVTPKIHEVMPVERLFSSNPKTIRFPYLLYASTDAVRAPISA
jgi:hypothetical protein